MEDSEVMRQKKIHYIYNKEMECMDPEERRKLQGERLRKTVELEYANVPAYRARMDEAGVKPEDKQHRRYCQAAIYAEDRSQG